MRIVILTGMSGAGKSTALNALEDMGYYCVDNIPPMLLRQFIGIVSMPGTVADKVAIVIDARSQKMFEDFSGYLDELKSLEIPFKLLFLEAETKEIVRRYKESRRRHPLFSDSVDSTESAIALEKKLLLPVHDMADYVIDSTYISAKQLRENIIALLNDDEDVVGGMVISVVSFGFKYGIPSDADLVFDLRCLPNPFYIPLLKEKTGMDAEVYDYVFGFEQANQLAEKLRDLLDFLVPNYIAEGKSRLVIAFGCTGGKHRSVSFARHFTDYLSGKYRKASFSNRDIGK